jgi:hypothetical protein
MFCCISQGAKASAVLANDNQCDQIIEKITQFFEEKSKQIQRLTFLIKNLKAR